MSPPEGVPSTWMARLLLWLSPRLTDPAEAQRLVWGTAGTMSVRVVVSALNLITGIVLARLLLTRGYGIFMFCWAWVDFLLALADMGMSTLVTQKTAAYAAARQWPLLRGLLRRADEIVLVASGVILIAGGAALAAGALGTDSVLPVTFAIALPLVPLLGLVNLRRSVLLGLERPVLSQLVRYLARPLMFWGVFVLGYQLSVLEVSPSAAMACELLACVGTLGLSCVAVRRLRPDALFRAAPRFTTRAWLLAALPMMVITHLGTFVWRVDVVMVGALSNMADAGVYSAATQWAGVVTYPFLALSIVLSPVVSRLYVQGEQAVLQGVTTGGVRLAFAVSTVLFAGLMAVAPRLLGAYGADFVAGSTALRILGAGQLATMVFGPVWIILVMTGHARVVAVLLLLSSVVNVALNALLIPLWGIEGAALASASVVNAFCAVGVWLVWQRLRLRSTILG